MFFLGGEDDEYCDNADNTRVYHLNTIANYDQDIIPLLNALFGAVFIRGEDRSFMEDHNGEKIKRYLRF